MKTLTIVMLFIIMSVPTSVRAEVDGARAINAIIGEAEGEPYNGKLAVACAIRNREQSRKGHGLKGVYGERSPRVKLAGKKAREDSRRAWEASSDSDACEFIDGADHWEGTAFKTPYWAKDMVITSTIGNQRFYRRK